MPNLKEGTNPHTGKTFLLLENKSNTIKVIGTYQTRIGVEVAKQKNKELFPNRTFYVLPATSVKDKFKDKFVKNKVEKLVTVEDDDGNVSKVSRTFVNYVPDPNTWKRRFNLSSLKEYKDHG